MYKINYFCSYLKFSEVKETKFGYLVLQISFLQDILKLNFILKSNSWQNSYLCYNVHVILPILSISTQAFEKTILYRNVAFFITELSN